MPAQALYINNTQVHLLNSDSCPIGQHVIVKWQSRPQTFIANVHEIFQQVGSLNYDNGMLDGLLFQTVAYVGTTNRLLVPHLVIQDKWSFVPLTVKCFYLFIDDSMKSQDVVCTMNMQHDCHHNGCQTSGIHYFYQEHI